MKRGLEFRGDLDLDRWELCSMLALLATQCRCLRLPKVPCGECGREADGTGPGEEKAEAQEASSRI